MKIEKLLTKTALVKHISDERKKNERTKEKGTKMNTGEQNEGNFGVLCVRGKQHDEK